MHRIAPAGQQQRQATVGIIANPVSARDIRRVVANANSLQLADRVNILLRLVAALGSCDIARVLVMPDREGLRPMLRRHLDRLHAAADEATVLPQVAWLEMPVTGCVDDSFRAARMLHEAGVAAIVVLGGDGTHRAVVRECGEVPVAGLSTGTNNAYPEMREATVAGLAVGLYAAGCIPDALALVPNKRLELSVNAGRADERRDIALVDVAISSEHFIGARALWKADTLSAVYLAYAEPEAIGISAIGGLLAPVGRREPGGLAIELAPEGRTILRAPIAPGLVRPVAVSGWRRMADGVPCRVRQASGVIALDGEREIAFVASDEITVTLRERAFRSIDIAACMRHAARAGLMRGAAPAVAPAPGIASPTPRPLQRRQA
ncbi:ATP-NAD kinase family protein [Variovorax sp. JS1663]|uniref:ATP-NAD kinase family protein n=1 Tax=Variovorax sp. JS1663 TaxID=1851577 RepID=UPI000B345D68|nr:NAD(+)/NADH kinase [Variovorax sp. JS1663]OUM02182.1 acetoin catabolism protein X [Variovorax sp. JS1663]